MSNSAILSLPWKQALHRGVPPSYARKRQVVCAIPSINFTVPHCRSWDPSQAGSRDQKTQVDWRCLFCTYHTPFYYTQPKCIESIIFQVILSCHYGFSPTQLDQEHILHPLPPSKYFYLWKICEDCVVWNLLEINALGEPAQLTHCWILQSLIRVCFLQTFEGGRD